MQTNKNLILIDRLDNSLSSTEASQVDAAIINDKPTATEWAFLKLAVDTIGLGAIRDKVSFALSASRQGAPVIAMVNKEGAVVRGMFRTTMRIAVAAVLILGASVIYKIISVDNVSLYNKAFTGYELGTFRGNVASEQMELAYRSENWTAVLDAFSRQATKTNKSYFLAGVAELQLKKYPAAVGYFEQVLSTNAKSGDRYFQPECEYFVALAYLINNQTAKGVAMMNKIKKDVNHPYYPLASKISAADLKILSYKSK